MPHTQYKFLISAAVKFTIIFKQVSMIYNPNQGILQDLTNERKYPQQMSTV